jgi:hypothetical protein
MNRYDVWMTRTEMIMRLRTVLNTAVTGHRPQNGKIIRHISLPNHFASGKRYNHRSTVIWYGASCHSDALSEAMNMRVIDLKVVQKKGYLNGRCDNDMSPGSSIGMIQTKHMNPIFNSK